MADRKSDRNKDKVMNYKVLHEDGTSSPSIVKPETIKVKHQSAGKNTGTEISSVQNPIGNLSAGKMTTNVNSTTDNLLSTPVKPPSDLDEESGKTEKLKLMHRLQELDKVQSRLQERRELEILRKQVQERESYIETLQHSLGEGSSDGAIVRPKSTIASGKSKPKLAASFGNPSSTEISSEKTGPQVYILSDSIAKHVTDIRLTKVHPFPGINISRLTSKIENDPVLVSKPFTIIHVGTNDINRFSEEEILSLFNNLISVIRAKSSTHIIISSILPRPVDHVLTGSKVKRINFLLKQKCLERKVQFICSFRPFFKFGKPLRDLFAVRDGGLHLNIEVLPV
ncbi:uncharacterized protein LOC132726519 [Ruditapes philippinarum]|uniref:uncharacterized protein LOC132726519 n=1 Tax=Ruditapes philippinarum TaxID=129788 RepID=UPI00295AF47E|nr:uncharacterized protein LOC132726519 [Ruditapes philippinarum]